MNPAAESTQRPPVEHSQGPIRRSAERRETVPVQTSLEPSHELIARRAYELFELRGGDHGHDVEDWFQAERESADPVREADMLTRETNEPQAN